jgi:hypothetical protein
MNSLNENQIIEKNNENEITNELNDQNYDNKNINEENIIDNDKNNNINFLLMDEIQILDYLTENKIDENIISQIKELKLNSKDLIYISKKDELLNKICNNDFHLKNIFLNFINSEIENALKIKITLDDNKELIITLENDPNYTLENITHNLGIILNNSNKLYLTPFSNQNEILLPNIKIIPRILSNPDKYTNLKIFDLKNIKGNNKNSSNDNNLNQGYSSYNAYMATQSVLQPNIYNSGYSSVNLHNRYRPGHLSNQDKNNNKINDSVYSTLNILSQSNNYTMKNPDNSYNNNLNSQMYNYSSKVNENDLNTNDYSSGNYSIPNKEINENKYNYSNISSTLKPNNQYTTNIKNSEYSTSYKIENINNEINKDQKPNQKTSYQKYSNYKSYSSNK